MTWNRDLLKFGTTECHEKYLWRFRWLIFISMATGDSFHVSPTPGDQCPGPDGGEEREDGGNRLFVFRFQDAAVVEPYRPGDVVSEHHHTRANQGQAPLTLEETCNPLFPTKG
ncbi:hypothetical protein J4Q44_G00347870 [Coregonus suidteri]|uniref:Uncharacterized protein n=1 Tax=Coregonus suidteri TaxID=861788 RepID=A0AAN8KK50_9TELE